VEENKACTYCGEEIKAAAVICRHCRINLTTGECVDGTRGLTVADGASAGCGCFIAVIVGIGVAFFAVIQFLANLK